MEKDRETDKYILQNKLRTWSAYRKEQEEKRAKEGSVSKDFKKLEAAMTGRVTYGGCVNGCNHPKPNGINDINGTNSAKGFTNGKGAATAQGNEAAAQELRDKLKVLEAGRDFGGSRSGAGSRIGSDDENSGGEEEVPVEKGVGGGYRGANNGECSSEPSDFIEKMVKRDQCNGLANEGERGGVKL